MSWRSQLNNLTHINNIFRFAIIPLTFIYQISGIIAQSINWDIFLTGMHSFISVIYGINVFFIFMLSMFYVTMCIIALRKEKTNTPKIPKGNEPTVTIQIPTYNEIAAINCAKKCLEFDYPKDKMQIIIGDDSSDSAISQKFDEFAQLHPNMVEVTRRGNNHGFKPGNLNHMLKFSKGEFLLLFDSDFLPGPDFLSRIIYPIYKDPTLSCVQSRWKIKNFNQNIFSVLGGAVSFNTHYMAEPFMSWLGCNAILGGSGELIRKKDLIELGGWLEGVLTEDIEMTLNLIMHGKKMIYLEDVIVECEAPHTFKDLCNQQKRWAFGNVTAFKRYLKPILTSKTIKRVDKLSLLIFVSGYIYAFLLFWLIILGILKSILPTANVVEVSALITILKILEATAITSGSLLISIIILFVLKEKRAIPRLIFGAFTIGLLVLVQANVGIFKAVFNIPMEWYILKKNGNELFDKPLVVEKRESISTK